MQRHLPNKFNRLILCVFILTTCLLSTGCWMTTMAVDTSPGAGLYVRSAHSPVPSWSLPVTISSSGLSINFAVEKDMNYIYSASVFSNASVGISNKYPHNPFNYNIIGRGTDSLQYTDMCIGDDNYYRYCGISYDTIYHINNLFFATNALGNPTTLFLGGNEKSYQTNIMLDSKDTTHIVYYDKTFNMLREAKVSVSNSGINDTYTSLRENTLFGAAAIGSDDEIHVLGFNTTTRKIEYFRASSPGSIHNLCSIPSVSIGYSPGLKIKVDKSGAVHALYCAYDGVLRYAVNSTGGLSTWSYSTVDMTGNPGYTGIDLAIDSKGRISAVYTRNNRQSLCLATLNGSTWNVQVLKTFDSSILWPTLIFNYLDELYIGFGDLNNNRTCFMTKSAKLTHISYCDSSSLLKYATEVDGMSSYETITTIGNLGNNDIAVDINGVPHIVFESPDNTLKIATRTNGSWSFETAFNSQLYHNPNNTNLELKYDSLNHPHLLYVDNNKTTVYGVKTSSNWGYTMFNLNHYGQPYISLVVDTSNLPRFAYTNVDSVTYPAYVFKTKSDWSTERIYTDNNNSGHRISMVLDGLGNPHVAYTSNFFTTMNYGYRKNGIWTNWTISTTMAIHIYSTKIALDEDQNPHIAYYLEDNNTIYYQCMIKKTGQSWLINNAGDINGGGNYLSLGLEQGYQPALSFQNSETNTLNFVNAYPETHNLPDIKLLRNGYTISSAFNVNEYFRSPVENWEGNPSMENILGKVYITTSGQVSYSSITGNGYTTDTQTIYYSPEGTNNYFTNRVKYLNTIIYKLPRVITEGNSVIENASVNINNYISTSSTASFPSSWMIHLLGTEVSKIGVGFNGSTVNFSLSSALRDNVIAKNYMGTSGYEDMEIFRIHPVLNTHSGFTISSETTNWAYQLPEGISIKPTISWNNTITNSTTYGGTWGSMAVNFTAANQGIKLTPLAPNWVKTEPYEWYTVRVLAKYDYTTLNAKDNKIESPDIVAPTNVQLLAYAFNGLPPAPTDVAAHFMSKISSSWHWYEIPLYSSGTSMYPTIVLKNGNTTTSRILINKVEIIKAKPGTELMYSKKWVSGMLSQFDSSTGTNAWAFQSIADPAIAPSYTIDSGKLIINFPDWNYRGIKMTSMVSPGTVRTGKTHAGKSSGVSFKYSYSGVLNYPVISFYLFNSAGVNDATFSEFVGCGSIYKTTTNEKGEYRTAYLPATSNGYVQIALKNGGPCKFYIDDLALESDWDTDNYWDSSVSFLESSLW